MKQTNNEKVKNGLTEVVFILDRSGSMSGYERDTIGGFNATIAKQKQEEGKAIVSTVLFDHEIEVVHDRVAIEDIPTMTDKEYQVRGTTALLDAIGGAIHHIGNIHKYARKEDVPEHTIFIITTDGMENASRNYNSRKVKEMIQRQQDKYGWEFIFLAANIDAVETADRYGIRRERAVNYCQTPEGVKESYCMMSEAISRVRKAEKLDNGDWKNVK
ncbi:MAG: VWA domain-containing protein [Clostridiales bacterium]|nr:VWA domain-containing protein [Clostridiales bacterium]